MWNTFNAYQDSKCFQNGKVNETNRMGVQIVIEINPLEFQVFLHFAPDMTFDIEVYIYIYRIHLHVSIQSALCKHE